MREGYIGWRDHRKEERRKRKPRCHGLISSSLGRVGHGKVARDGHPTPNSEDPKEIARCNKTRRKELFGIFFWILHVHEAAHGSL